MLHKPLGLIGLGSWGQNYLKTLHGMGQPVFVLGNPKRISDDSLRQKTLFLSSMDELLYRSDIPSVIVATPPSTHYALGESLLLSGKDVLMEKPMTLSYHDSLRLHDLACEKERILMVGHLYYYHSGVSKLQEVAMDHKTSLGNLLSFTSKRLSPGPKRKDVGALWDLAPHDFYLAGLLTHQQPSTLFARSSSVESPEEDALIDISYDTGLTGQIQVSKIHSHKVRETTLCFEEGQLLFDDVHPQHLVLFTHKGKQSSFSYSLRPSPLELEVRAFLHAVESRRQPLAHSLDGVNNTFLVEKTYESLHTGGAVPI
jgi:predicted dehydrogenase